MLWTSKNEFLENQKAEKAKELEEYHTNFELAMSRVNQKGQTEKDKAKKENEAIMKAMETRHTEQLKDLNETVNKHRAEKDKLKKDHELEIQKIKANASNSKSNDDSLRDAMTKIEDQKEDIRSLKNERGKSLSDMKLEVEKEKKALVSKTEELNTKLKFVEQEKTTMH